MNNSIELTSAEKVQRIREAQRQYNKDYYQKNRKTLLARKRKWRKENPEKVKQSIENYWLRKAEENKQI